MNEQRCETCRYADADYWPNTGRYLCRYDSPRMPAQIPGTVAYRCDKWPTVLHDDWCGRWEGAGSVRLTGPIPIASSYTVEYILRDDMKEPFRRISVAADCGADAEKKVYESHSPGAIVVTRVTRNMSCARREGD